MTAKVKVVGVVVAPKGLPVISTWYEPVGVEEMVLTVSWLVTPTKEGVTDDGLNEHDAPAGREEGAQDKATAGTVPLVKVAVTVLLPELPCWALISPEFDSEKSYGGIEMSTFTTTAGIENVPK